MLKGFEIWKLFGQNLTKWSQDDLCFHFSCVPSSSWAKISLKIYKASLKLRGAVVVQGCRPRFHLTSGLSSDWTDAGWKDGRAKSRIGMILLLVLRGQREHWRSIWPEAVLQPDHRHKLTTCVLVSETRQAPSAWKRIYILLAGFVLEKDKWEIQLWSSIVFHRTSLNI